MSFILDALRKVEKRKAGTGEIRVAKEVLAPRRARRYAGAAMLVGIALVSALVTAGAMRFFATGEASEPVSSTVSSETPESAGAPEQELGEPTVLEPEPRPTAARPRQAAAPAAVVLEPRTDASRDGEAQAAPEPEPEPELELVLQGTSVLNGEPVAVISDQRVFVGDRIGGALVISIEAGRVVLEREGERLELTL